MPTSGDTLLRLIRNHPEPSIGPLRVVGVDDWALRKGQRYGTILVDLEARQVVELLPDRQAGTLQTWLAHHRSIKIVTRDRSREYAQGISAGAPNAIQVADRWHLLKNMGEVAERGLQEIYPKLKEKLTLATNIDTRDSASLRGSFPRGKSTEKVRQERRAKRMKRYELIQYLRANGLSTRRIARILGLSRGTVIRYARAEVFPEWQSREQRPSILDPYLPYLEARVQAGCQNGQQLWREIVEQGYPGSVSQVSKWMTWRRRQQATPQAVDLAQLTPVTLLPSAFLLTALLARSVKELSQDQRWLLEQLMQIPLISRIWHLVQSFVKMFREGLAEELDAWLEKCKQLGIGAFERFAEGLMQDYDAVRAALESQWSNGQTEGQINRLKLLKRQMVRRVTRRSIASTGSLD